MNLQCPDKMLEQIQKWADIFHLGLTQSQSVQIYMCIESTVIYEMQSVNDNCYIQKVLNHWILNTSYITCCRNTQKYFVTI